MSQTTTRSGFKVEDITFKNARRQSEIDKELGVDTVSDEEELKTPISLTPEQVIRYYEESIANTDSVSKKRLYAQTIKWIKELQEANTKLLHYRQKELRETVNKNVIPTDI